MNKLAILTYLILALTVTGCATNLTSTMAPGANFSELGKTAVVRFEPDKRHLNRIIADQLTLMGHKAVAVEESGISKDIDTLVTYKDNW